MLGVLYKKIKFFLKDLQILLVFNTRVRSKLKGIASKSNKFEI
jgi:hypothetical protein